MANYKRKKSRRQVKCKICTDARVGNSDQAGYRKPSVVLKRKVAKISQREQKDELT